MKKIITIAFVFSLLAACQNINYPAKPKNLIPEEKMAEVLTDLHIFNASKSYNRNMLQESGLSPQQFIFEKHGIDSLQFQKSNAYYSINPDKYLSIYNKIQNSLEIRKTEIDTIIAIETRKREDSIQKMTDSVRLKRVD